MTTPRPRQRPGRVAAGIAIATLVVLAATVAWRVTSLRGLPEIGPTIDLAAVKSVELRDEDNAAILYREAAAKYVDLGHSLVLNWATAPADERDWLESNRDALAIWRRATERPDALFIPPAKLTFDTNLDILQALRSFVRLIGLETSRLEGQGDFASAWEWHRAALRSSRHCGRHGVMIERLVGVALYTVSAFRITSWASDPKVDAPMLRRALAEVRAIDAMTEPASTAIKLEYLSFTQTSVEAMRRAFEAMIQPEESSGRWHTIKADVRMVESVLRREPERSRRLFALFVANWLPYCDLPPSQRPYYDPLFYLAFEPDESAPANARIFTRAQLLAWNDSTVLLKRLLPSNGAFLASIDRERATRAALIVHLASELHAREHGKPPETPEALVPEYLDSLPIPK